MKTQSTRMIGRALCTALRPLFLLKRSVPSLFILIVLASFGRLSAQTYTFTNAGATGRQGPSQTQVNSTYSSTSLDGKVTIVGSGIQQWIVPFSGLYKIKADGARGGNATNGPSPGNGASMEGEFFLAAGDTVWILVGQMGQDRLYSGGGGGGTFVTRSPHNTTNSILIIAGGGGASSADSAGYNGVTGTCGTFGDQSGPAACNGDGGISFTGNSGSGGGGFFSDGQGGGIGTGGSSYISGGLGGATNNQQEGGFGGGGGQDGTGTYAASGGGGYSGGNGGNRASSRVGGGGGGSWNAGNNQTNLAGANANHGSVTITALRGVAFNDAGVVSIDTPRVFCSGTHNVVVTVQNFGINKVDSVTLNWTVNGTVQTAVKFIGTLDTMGGTGSTSASVNLGSFNFTSTPNEIKVWTSAPNGGTDTVNTNDTITELKQPNIPAPGGLTSSTLDSTSATLSWTAGNLNNTWAYVNSSVMMTPTGPGTVVTTDSVVLSGLIRASTYYFYVREICSSGDSSSWAGPISYKTTCSGPLSGTYSVDPGQAVSNSNFTSFSDALEALYTCTVGGHVTFNLAANIGPFPGGTELTAIPGASATNTVTLNGNGNVINESAASYFLALNGVSYLTINDFKFINTVPTVQKFGIMLRGASHHIQITNNLINMGTGYTSSLSACIAVSNLTTSATSAGDNAQYVTITGNELVGAYYSMTLIGQTSYTNNFGHLVSNNIIRDFYMYGVYLVNADTVTVENNDISRNDRPTYTTFYGTYLSTSRNIKILKNAIHSTGEDSYSAYPIYITTSENSSGYETEIINNKIYDIPTTSTTYGIYGLGTRDYINIYHNTIDLLTDGSTGAKRNVYFSTAPNNHTLRNNILSIRGSGTGTKHCIYVSSTSTSFSSNNNVLYNGATAGTNYTGYWSGNRTTLAIWQTNSGGDANSQDDDPQFAQPASGNLMPLTTQVDNIGTSVGVSTDFNGNSRSVSTPDVGAYEFTGIAGDVRLVSGELIHTNLCYNTSDTAEFIIENPFGLTVDFATDSLRIVWDVTGPVNSNGTVLVNSDTLSVGSSRSIKVFDVDMSIPGTYYLNAYIQPNAANLSAFNDTLVEPFEFEISSILAVSPALSTLNNYGDSVALTAHSTLFPGSFFITEICHFKTTTGSPAGGWPSYLTADDYIEITGAPNSDLAGITLEQWTTTMVSTYTFPQGTVLNSSGTAVIAVGQMGSSVESPSDFYYHGQGSYTGSFSSTGTAGRILKDASGKIIDAVVYGNYTFPAGAGVTSSDWSGTTTSSNSGNRLIGAYTKDATNWVQSSATYPQDPNTVNSGVQAPSTPILTGFSWKLNTIVVDTVRTITAGPYITHGTYEYIATFTNHCGTFYDTAVVVVPPILDLAADLTLPGTITCGNDMPVQVKITNMATEDIDFDIDNATVTVEVTGTSTQTFTLVVDDNSFNSNQPLAKGSDMIVSLGNLNIDATGTYYFVASVSISGDLDTSDNLDVMDSVVLGPIAEAGSDYQVCSGSPSLIGGNPTAIGGTAPFTYSWTPSANFADATLANPLATVSSNTVFTVLVTDNLGCYSVDSMLVEALSTPSPLVSGDSTVCIGIQPYSTPLNAGTTYEWSVTGGTIIGSNTAETVSVSWNQSGTGSVSVKQTITAGGCFATSSLTVTINPNPSITYTATGATTFCDGNDVGLLAIPQSGFTYEWRRDGITLSGTTSNVYTAATSGDYKVVVTNSNGCTDSSSAITVTVNPLPTATITPSGATTFCDGGSVDLVANTGTGLSYQWMMNNSAINGANSASYTAIAQGNYSVKVSDANGCDATSSQQSIVVNALPTASIVAIGATTVCQGQDVNLSAVPVSGASYQWRLDGTDISGATTANYVATTSGAYTIRVTSAASCEAISNSISVTVNPLPTATITPAGATTFCDGGSVDLDANTGTGLSYQWMLNGTAISGATSASYTAAASGNYTVEVTNAQGCSEISSARAVTVNPLPTATIVAMGSLTFCQGGNVILSAIPVSGATYAWSLNGNPINGATSSTHTATASGNYTVEVTSSASCSQVSNTLAVSVNPLPIAGITPSGPISFCDGSSVDLVSGAATGTTQQWYSNGLPISGATSGTYTASISGVYTVKVTSADGCEATSTPVTVTVNPMPMAVIVFTGPTTFCQGENSVLVGLSQSGYSYQWFRDGNAIAGATSNMYTADQSGNYVLEVTSSANCMASTAGVNITVNPLPTASITSAGPTTVCAGNTVVLDANTGAGLTYQWYHNGNLITNAISASYTAMISGNYTVSVTSASGCKAVSAITGVTINPAPTASITAQGATTVCDGTGVVLTAATASNGTYQWMQDGTAINGETSTSYTATTTGDYTIVVTDAVTSCFSESLPISVTVSPQPITLFEASDVCLGNDADFSNESVINVGGMTYEWNFGDGNTSTDENPSHTYAATGTYNVTLTATSNQGINCMAVYDRDVAVFPKPVSTFTTVKLSNNLVDFVADDSTATSYNWDFGDSTTSTDKVVQHQYADGTYLVSLSVTNADGCESVSTGTITLDLTGIRNGEENTLKFGVYPNPFHSEAKIAYELIAGSEVKIEVYDQLGRLVATLTDGNQEAGSHVHVLSAGDIVPQTLIVRLTVDNKVYNQKVVLIR